MVFCHVTNISSPMTSDHSQTWKIRRTGLYFTGIKFRRNVSHEMSHDIVFEFFKKYLCGTIFRFTICGGIRVLQHFNRIYKKDLVFWFVYWLVTMETGFENSIWKVKSFVLQKFGHLHFLVNLFLINLFAGICYVLLDH